MSPRKDDPGHKPGPAEICVIIEAVTSPVSCPDLQCDDGVDLLKRPLRPPITEPLERLHHGDHPTRLVYAELLLVVPRYNLIPIMMTMMMMMIINDTDDDSYNYDDDNDHGDNNDDG